MNNLELLIFKAECAMRKSDEPAVRRLLDQIAQRQEHLAKLAQIRAERQRLLDRRIKRLVHWSEPH